MKPLSADLRERVVRLVESGASRHEAAATFEVSVSSAIRWCQRWRLMGSVAALPMGGDHGSRIKGEDATWVLAVVKAEPDLTIEEIRARLRAERQLEVGYGTMWRFLKKSGLRVKKKPARQRTRAA